MTPEDLARKPVPLAVIPAVRDVAKNPTAVRRILAVVDDDGLRRLLDCGWAQPIQAALLTEARRRRILDRRRIDV